MSYEYRYLHDHEKDILLKNNGWNKLCPVNIDRLHIVDVIYIDFENNIKKGSIICIDVISENIIEIFKNLLEVEFNIFSIKPIWDFDFSDEISMKNNNSSCFFYRKITDSNKLSLHSYGTAIDINPLQNPFIKLEKNTEYYSDLKIFPSEGYNFINRSNLRKGMLEPVVSIFYKNGFTEWGGNWNTPLDYHHFQIPRIVSEKMVNSDFITGKKIWINHITGR